MTSLAYIATFEKQLRYFGTWVITPFFAVGSGIITTVAVSTFPFIYGLALPWLIPILLAVFISETAISAYLFKDSVPETLTTIFVHNIFKGLSPTKKTLLGLGIFSALGGGLALGALTYMSGAAALSAVFALFSMAVPPVGIAIVSVLAITAFIAYSSLLIKWISSAIRNDIHKQVFSYFKDIFTRDLNKPLLQQILEGGFKLLFTSSIFLLTIVGTIATLGTMQKGLTAFFSLIPKANLFATQLASGIISYGLMGIARLPWALQSVCSAFSKMGEWIGRSIFRAGCSIARALGMQAPTPVVSKVQTGTRDETILSTTAKVAAVLIHSFSFGAIARTGGGHVISQLMTNLKVPLSTPTIEDSGQVASVISAGMMAGGISVFALFQQPRHKQSQPIPSTTAYLKRP